MSAPAPTVVAPSGAAATATPLKGGAIALSPLPLSGGRRRSRKLSKKARKALKTLKKMGGDEIEEAVAPVVAGAEEMPVEGARRRKSRKGSKKTRRSSRRSFLY
jgi:hypothetical protein